MVPLLPPHSSALFFSPSHTPFQLPSPVMGNRICCGRRSLVDERLTRPQRLLRKPSNVDYRKLRRLIRAEKLAPCFDAEDEPGFDLEECPICFFYFPSLNRSTCCLKGICTECFLQMKPMSPLPDSTNCPFCKTSGYAVEYRGTRSEEEKAREKAEEQKVIEARIRMQLQDSRRVNHGMLVDNAHSVLEVHLPKQCFQGLCDVLDGSASTPERDADTDDPLPSSSGSPNLAYVQDGDHEDALLIEAVWQSLKDPKLWKNGISGASNLEPDVRIHVKEEYTNSRVVMSKDFLEMLSAEPESPDTDTG